MEIFNKKELKMKNKILLVSLLLMSCTSFALPTIGFMDLSGSVYEMSGETVTATFNITPGSGFSNYAPVGTQQITAKSSNSGAWGFSQSELATAMHPDAPVTMNVDVTISISDPWGGGNNFSFPTQTYTMSNGFLSGPSITIDECTLEPDASAPTERPVIAINCN